MPMPFSRPTIAPEASAAPHPSASASSLPLVMRVSRMAAKFSVQLTERSIPPVRITIVWPAATTPR